MERSLIIEKFRQATVRWNQKENAQSEEDHDNGKHEEKSQMIVVTDACLPLLSSGESPIAARVLINYELPTKKVEFPLYLKDLNVLSMHVFISTDDSYPFSFDT